MKTLLRGQERVRKAGESGEMILRGSPGKQRIIERLKKLIRQDDIFKEKLCIGSSRPTRGEKLCRDVEGARNESVIE
jgi:hypothetical protein